jgi:N-acetylglucosaminyldiphosphoundecaprenol N-acetyl-beta-D-mannosaminyltransferase
MLPSIQLFGMDIHVADMQTAAGTVLGWCKSSEPLQCRYVVTPNVDHVVMFQTRADLRATYAAASLVVADGFPVVLASKLLRRPLPERVAGSDLVPAVFDGASACRDAPLRVFLLGAGPGVAERAADRIHRRWSGVQVVGTYSPPLGFEHETAENAAIVDRVAAAEADLLIIGLGAPKQELWIHQYAALLPVRAALCVGATIDFLAGEKARSPRWMQRVGLEWVHRLVSEPKRLAKRYLRDAWIFPRLVWREWRGC